MTENELGLGCPPFTNRKTSPALSASTTVLWIRIMVVVMAAGREEVMVVIRAVVRMVAWAGRFPDRTTVQLVQSSEGGSTVRLCLISHQLVVSPAVGEVFST